MTNQELRKLAVDQRDTICPWCKNHEPHEVYGCVYRQTELALGQHGDAILRLLDEHQLMAEALFVIANNGVHIPENPTSHCDYARDILNQCKGVVIT